MDNNLEIVKQLLAQTNDLINSNQVNADNKNLNVLSNILKDYIQRNSVDNTPRGINITRPMRRNEANKPLNQNREITPLEPTKEQAPVIKPKEEPAPVAKPKEEQPYISIKGRSNKEDVLFVAAIVDSSSEVQKEFINSLVKILKGEYEGTK